MNMGACVEYQGADIQTHRLIEKRKFAGGIYETDGFRYDAGLAALVNAGYTRYPYVREVFGIAIEVLEHRASPGVQEVFKDMSSHGYEWSSLAWECRGNILIAYVDPTGLKWQEGGGYKYWTPQFAYKEKREFSLKNLKNRKKGASHSTRHRISEFDDEFTEFHCGRPFDCLPEEIKNGKNAIRVDLPRDRFLVPVAYELSIILFGHFGCNGRARGVR